LLWFPEEADLMTSEDGKPDAITTFFMFPHNSLLGVEIAKTLFYRRRFQEAIEILRLVLSIDPTDPTARTMRMILFRELAVNAPSFFISCQFFSQAEQEALFIQENCEVKFEDFYCEYASLFLTRALMTVRNLRSGRGGQDGVPETTAARRSIFEALALAERLFERAITVAPWAIRSTYSLNTTRILSAILRDDEEILSNPAKPLNGRPETVVRPGSGFQWQLSLIKSGIVPDDNPTLRNRDFIEKMLVKRFRLHDESIALPAYRANAHYCHAVALWDFCPTRTVGVLKRVLKMLQSAMDIAERAAREDICIYSSTRAHSEMMQAEIFIGHMKRCIRTVEDSGGKALATRDDREVVPTIDGEVFPILLTLNFT
jgi:tetratricopeptide (TPR) repeat protein